MVVLLYVSVCKFLKKVLVSVLFFLSLGMSMEYVIGMLEYEVFDILCNVYNVFLNWFGSGVLLFK